MIPAYWSPTKKLMVLGAMAGGKLVEDTATGNPLTFITDVSKPLKSLFVPFTPIQSGTGDPSPQNIRPLVPWEGLTVFGGGKNLFDEVYPDIDTSVKYRAIYVGNSKVTVSSTCHLGGGKGAAIFALAGNRSSGATTSTNGVSSGISRTITPVGGYITIGYRIVYGEDPRDCDTQIEVGETATTYEPPTITETDIPFVSPVYGGTLDVVSGVLTVEWADFKFKWSECTEPIDRGDFEERKYSHGGVLSSKNGGNGICNVAPFSWTTAHRTWFYMGSVSIIICLPDGTPENTEIEVCAKLATPQEIQLTPAQITALVGDNTIWSDADGSMTAVYPKKG